MPSIVVHDDLQAENILFHNNRISGVIDFGDTTVGTIAQELRQLYRIDERAVQFAIESYYATTGIEIDSREIKIWAITQELAAYCRWLARGDLQHPSLMRAKANLMNWLPIFAEQTRADE